MRLITLPFRLAIFAVLFLPWLALVAISCAISVAAGAEAWGPMWRRTRERIDHRAHRFAEAISWPLYCLLWFKAPLRWARPILDDDEVAGIEVVGMDFNEACVKMPCLFGYEYEPRPVAKMATADLIAMLDKKKAAPPGSDF